MREIPKIAGTIRYTEEKGTLDVICCCHGYRYTTPAVMVQAHKGMNAR